MPLGCELSCRAAPQHDVFPQDPRRPRPRHPGRALLRRARAGAQVGRGRLRQAAPDDRAALRHGLDRSKPRLARRRRRAAARASRRRRPRGALDGRTDVRVAGAADVPDASRLPHSSARRSSSAVRRSTSSTCISRRIRSTRSPTTSCRRWSSSQSFSGLP